MKLSLSSWGRDMPFYQAVLIVCLIWWLFAPSEPKAVPTPGQLEAQRLQLEGLNQFLAQINTDLWALVWPLLLLFGLPLLALFVVRLIRPK